MKFKIGDEVLIYTPDASDREQRLYNEKGRVVEVRLVGHYPYTVLTDCPPYEHEYAEHELLPNPTEGELN